MPNLWDRWKEFSDRISTVLVVVCALFSVAGGIELISLTGPLWIAILFILFGAGMLGLVAYSLKNRS